MGPVEVAAGVAALVVCIGVTVWAVTARRRRARADARARGADDTALRTAAQERLERAAAQWNARAAPEPASEPAPDPSTGSPTATAAPGDDDARPERVDWKGPRHGRA